MKNKKIIPIFLPYGGCLNRCIFCNQRAISKDIPSPLSVKKFIESSLLTLSPIKNKTYRQVAFYGGSFTAMDKDEQIKYLQIAKEFILKGEIESIRISTRPDFIDEETISFLRDFHVKTIEIGAQSFDDEVLQLSNRGHTKEDTISSVKILKTLGFEVGIQLMIGLPGDTLKKFLETLDRVIDLKPDFIRIHPTLVLKDSPLENLWKSNQYVPLSLKDAINWLKKGILKLENASIPIARIGLQPTKELEAHLLAGPYHPAIRQLVESSIFFDMAFELLKRNTILSQAIFICHPKEESNLRGQRNENIKKLKTEFGIKELLIQVKEDIERKSLILKNESETFLIKRKNLPFEEI
jgi:radical SAM enzyme (TIGR01210 family)